MTLSLISLTAEMRKHKIQGAPPLGSVLVPKSSCVFWVKNREDVPFELYTHGQGGKIMSTQAVMFLGENKFKSKLAPFTTAIYHSIKVLHEGKEVDLFPTTDNDYKRWNGYESLLSCLRNEFWLVK